MAVLVLLHLSDLSPQGARLCLVLLSDLAQSAQFRAEVAGLLLAWLMVDQLSQLDQISLQLTELHLHVGDDGGQLGVLGLFRAEGLTLLVSRRAGGGGGGVCVCTVAGPLLYMFGVWVFCFSDLQFPAITDALLLHRGVVGPNSRVPFQWLLCEDQVADVSILVGVREECLWSFL